MEPSDAERALAALTAHAGVLGLDVADAIVLHDSNRLAVRLVPCDVLARVAPADRSNRSVAEFEIDVARWFARPGSVVGTLEPSIDAHVHEHDEFAITYWTYYEPRSTEIAPADYARALRDLHVEMRRDDIAAPHVADRVDEALAIVTDAVQSPDLTEADRALLIDTLTTLRRTVVGRATHEQLLHGEPHPGNVLNTAEGVRFIDLQTCCRGPVEFDLAHAPDEVAPYYVGADSAQLRDCRQLVRAMVAAWRADRTDQMPDGQRMLDRLLAEIRHEQPGALGE